MGPIRLVEKEYRVVYEESSVGHKLLYRAFETKGEDTLNLSKQLNVRQADVLTRWKSLNCHFFLTIFMQKYYSL